MILFPFNQAGTHDISGKRLRNTILPYEIASVRPVALMGITRKRIRQRVRLFFVEVDSPSFGLVPI